MPLSVTIPPNAWNHRKGSPSSRMPSAAPKTGNRLPKYPAVFGPIRITPRFQHVKPTTLALEDSSRLGLLPTAARYSLAQWAHFRWARFLLGRGAGNPLLLGGCGFRPVRGCWNHMNDLVATAFELVENFGQREDGAGVNVVQQQDAPAVRLDTAEGASRNLTIVDAGPVVRHE